MELHPFSDKKIVDSWHQNAKAWTVAVRQGQIANRTLVTNQAIVDAVLSRTPQSVVDIGCGEGWLARELSAQGIQVLGVDVVPELIEQARTTGTTQFELLSYEAIAAGRLKAKFDVAVANFSLIGNESVVSLIQAVPALLTPNGTFIVQTIHPVGGCGEQPYQDGWRAGSWAGFSPDFVDPAPWYFRTLESWTRLFVDSGLRLVELREPLHPGTGKPASIIFMGTRSPL
uniref:class I SAM-dependent DNA methyltransferase n=1 Tax=Trichocoleus desertorum TaxID=1481672 RepID=UPI0025B32391|nr:class I SAM-dependent methyltransferase [Trichocoleus desertorum]